MAGSRSSEKRLRSAGITTLRERTSARYSSTRSPICSRPAGGLAIASPALVILRQYDWVFPRTYSSKLYLILTTGSDLPRLLAKTL